MFRPATSRPLSYDGRGAGCRGRNRLSGEWAAGLMPLDADDRVAYAQEVVHEVFGYSDDELVRKIWKDLERREVKMGRDQVKAKLAECLELAREQVGG